jgi:ketosteroid isomerase-like protein
MMDRNHPAFKKNAQPFHDIIMEGLEGEVDGQHFWDAVAEDAVFEFLYRFPGFPQKINGRKKYMEWFGGYSNSGFVNYGFCSIITIKDRKIVYWRDYMDSLAVSLALNEE